MTYVTDTYVVTYDETSGDYLLERLPDAHSTTETDDMQNAIPEWVNRPGERLARMVPGAVVTVVQANGPLREWWVGATIESVSRDRKTATLVRLNADGRESRHTVATNTFSVA